MLELERSSNVGPSVTPYSNDDDPSFQPGHRTTCELCGSATRCFEEYGLTACPDCHGDLLPGSGVF